MHIYVNYPEGENLLIPLHNRDLSYRLHMHDCLEVSYCVAGSVSVTVAGEVLQLHRGAGVIIPPNTVHSYETAHTSEFYTILFGKALVRELTNLLEQKKPENLIFPVSPELLRQLLDYDSSGTVLAGKALLYRTADMFIQNNRFVPRDTTVDTMAVKLLTYLQNNFQQEITLESFAQAADYSYYYVSKLVKKHLGISFTQLLAQYRVAYACHLLRGRNATISQIAMDSGFGSIRNFNRVFLATTGMTPKQYLEKETTGYGL